MAGGTLRALKPPLSQVKPEQCSLLKNILCSSDNQEENDYCMEDHNQPKSKSSETTQGLYRSQTRPSETSCADSSDLFHDF